MTYVLLPGAGGDPWYWHLVAPLLRERGDEVLTPRLPAADDSAGLREYADAALREIGNRGDLTVVAQSLAAFVAPMLCARADVRRMILVVPMIPAAGETPGEWWQASGQLAAMREQDLRDGRDPDAPFDPVTMFLHDLSPDVRAAAMAGEPEQSGRPMEDVWPLETWPDVPTKVIAGRHDRLLPLEFMRRLARERLGIDPEVIDSGHLPALARPRELAALL